MFGRTMMLLSFTLAVDLDAARAAPGDAGIRSVDESNGALRLDPADTFGIRLELVAG